MRAILFIILILKLTTCLAQGTETDSLKRLLDKTDNQQTEVSLYESLSYAYLSSYPDTAMHFALKGLQLAKDISWLKGEAICTDAIGNVYFHIGDNAKALELYLQYLQLKERLKDYTSISIAYYNIASVYTEEKDYRNALVYLFKAVNADIKNKDSSAYLYDLYSLGSIYSRMQVNDSALYYISKAYILVQQLGDENMMGAVLNICGDVWLSLQQPDTAAAYYRKSMPYAEAVTDNEVISANDFGMAKVFYQKNKTDSSLSYARKAYQTAYEGPFFKQALEISLYISNLYKEQRRFDSAFYYQQQSNDIKDSLFNASNITRVQNMKLDEQQRQQSVITREIKYQNNIRLFIVIAVAIILLVTAIAFWRNYRAKKMANRKLQDALAELKSTQAQLIQSEKMASLGELTAGIAHEIQNPLNFVNNFSELNNELIAEMNAETDVEEIKAIAADIRHNNDKINRHGKRADAIVKGMLEHSKRSSGKKELININALCDEYLRLSYHGARAKDKDFHAELKTDYDKSIQNINLVPQNMGRVLLNVFNNAFYALSEKKKQETDNYHLEIKVATQQTTDNIEITVTDNGTGIPPDIIWKIFQPFFTTKPTGQGTGLGLSLAYDVITKEYNGTIRAESEPGRGSRFVIIFPKV